MNPQIKEINHPNIDKNFGKVDSYGNYLLCWKGPGKMPTYEGPGGCEAYEATHFLVYHLLPAIKIMRDIQNGNDNTLASGIQGNERKITECKEQTTALRNRVGLLERRSDAHESQGASKHETTQALAEKLEKAVSSIGVLETSLAQVVEENSELKRECRELREKDAERERMLQEHQRSITAHSESQEALKRKEEEREGKVANLGDSVTGLKGDLAKGQAGQARIRQLVADLGGDFERGRRESFTLKYQTERQIKDFAKETKSTAMRIVNSRLASMDAFLQSHCEPPSFPLPADAFFPSDSEQD